MNEPEQQPVEESPAENEVEGAADTSSGGGKAQGKPFADFELPDDVLSSLKAVGISHCTPIQEKVIDPILAGGDIIGKAETGTGKTIGFGAPLVAKIETQRVAVQGIVLTPTRELAQQVAEVIESLGKGRDLEVALLVGGVHASGQIAKLRKGSQVVVGTPGRVLDLLKGGSLSLGWCETVVLDEADRMLDMGFIDEVGSILDKIPRERQTLLFSATMPKGMQKLLGRYMRDPQTYSTARGLATVPDIQQCYISLTVHKKLNALRRILDDNPDDTAIIFCNTKRQVIDLDRMLWGNGYSAGSLHGDQTQDLRFSIMDKFRAGDIKVLVATDVASRGLDIEAVTRVINYDVPEESESYVHRIGRTGRANLRGIAITLVTPKDRRYWDQILKDTRFKISSLEREEGRRMGNNRDSGEGSGNRDEGSGEKPRRRRRRRGRRGKSGDGDGDARQGQPRGKGRQGSSGRDESGGGRSRRRKSSRGRRGKGSGDGPKPPRQEPEFGSMEEMEETVAEVKNQNEEKKKRQQARPEKIALDVVDDDYLKEEYFNVDSEVLQRADSISPRKKRGEGENKSGGEGGRRKRRRRSRSGGGGRKRQGGGGRPSGEKSGGEKSSGEKSGGEQQSAEGSRRKRRPRRRRRRRGGGGGGGGGGGES